MSLCTLVLWDFNPHLRVGGDFALLILPARPVHFNPHLRVGGDAPWCPALAGASKFQSTPPRRR